MAGVGEALALLQEGYHRDIVWLNFTLWVMQI